MIVETRASIPVFTDLLLRCRVRHRFRATFSRQPRQVRKEATVTGSFVCSGAPVPGYLFFCARLASRVVVAGRGARLSTDKVYDHASLLRQRREARIRFGGRRGYITFG